MADTRCYLEVKAYTAAGRPGKVAYLTGFHVATPRLVRDRAAKGKAWRGIDFFHTFSFLWACLGRLLN